MLFNSINYFIFLLIVFILYYLFPNKYRWIILLLSSVFFYLWGEISTFIIPFIIITVTFVCGKMIFLAKNAFRKKLYFFSGILINFVLLVYFKYINFILLTLINGLDIIESLFIPSKIHNPHSIFLNITIPIGISFITFQAIGYLIEIWRSSKEPEKHFGIFATYLLFFPKLLSGPIERAHNFIPQLYQNNKLSYDNFVEGCKRLVIGLFMKLVVADRLAIYTNTIFNYPEQHSRITLITASVFFTIQLFSDFAGYTEIAIGSARILGYKLMENFNAPFLSKSITEFWSRWHISLSNWLRDYLFLPLSYSIARRYMMKSKKLFKTEYLSYITAVLITMTVCGIWHGASWNFVIFGFLQGFIMSFELVTRKARKKIKRHIPSWIDTVFGICFTFTFFSFTTIFFKSNTTADAFTFIERIFTVQGSLYMGEWQQFAFCIMSIFLLILIYFIKVIWLKVDILLKTKLWLIPQFAYALIIILILLLGVFDGGQFIYFQF